MLNELKNKKVYCKFCNKLIDLEKGLECKDCAAIDLKHFYVVVKKGLRGGLTGRNGIYNLQDFYMEILEGIITEEPEARLRQQIKNVDYLLEDK